MMQRNISFTEDIIEEVAKEFGITEDEAMAVYTTEVHYIRDLMDKDDNCAITIPYVGTMHVNKGLLYKSIKAQEQALENGFKIDREKYESNLRRMDKILELEKKRKASDSGEPCNHSKRTILRKLKRKTGKNLLEIEEIQKEKNG
jgi:hypothetical protein